MEEQGGQSHFKNTTESESNNNKNYYNKNNNVHRNLMLKTEMCKRFRRGVCNHGAKCDYAHSVAELRRQPKLCRLFLQTQQCSYGRNCRFLHSAPPGSDSATPGSDSATPMPPPSTFPIPNPQFQPEVEKLDGFSSAEYKRMRTSAAAPSDSYPSAENKTIQSDAAGAGAAGATAGAGAAATNATTSTPGTSSSQNKDPYAVKFVFKENKLEKVDGIYGDWIPDLPH